MHRMHCESSRQYDVIVSPGLLADGNPLLADTIGVRRALVVTDTTVDERYGALLRQRLPGAAVLALELDEQRKSIATVLEICQAAHDLGLGRRDMLVAFGGGIVCDLVSVAATLVRRGIPYVCVPSTLVGQIDAGIGLKGGVNFAGAKNYLGTFVPPTGVLIDPTLLATVDARELRCGLAEIVKLALVCDAGLFDLVAEQGASLVASGFQSAGAATIIDRAIRGMLAELSQNAYEIDGFARLMDFGHTFSPMLEERSGYALRHGEAVSIDIALSSAIGVEVGLLRLEDHERIVAILHALGLPVSSGLLGLPLLSAAISSVVAHRDGELNLVVPERIGAGAFVKSAEALSVPVLESALARLAG